MKTKIIPLIISFFLLESCCENEEKPIIYWSNVGQIQYKSTIGFDFDSALDSLLKVKVFRPVEPYIIIPEPIVVYNSTDERDFLLITFKDTNNYMYLASPSDVLDTKGCWYKTIQPED